MFRQIDVIGIYAVEASQPCYLVELLIRQHTGPIDVGRFTQATPGQPQSNWQVPWDERVLNSDGTADLLGRYPSKIVADGTPLRLAFFFHYLNFERPLITPAGDVILPSAETVPSRLAFLEYEAPG